MTVRRLLIALFLALVGYGSLAVLFQDWNPAARWGVALDRDTAVRRARDLAAERGLDVAGWDLFVVSTGRSDDIERCLALRPELRDVAFFSPVGILVVFRRPGSAEEESFRVRLDADGRLSAYLHRFAATAPSGGTGGESTTPSGGTGGESTAARPPAHEARPAAERALRDLAGAEAAAYRLVSSRERGQDGILFTWERTPPEIPEATVRVEILVRAASHLSSSGGPEAAEARVRVRFDERYRESSLWPDRRPVGTLGQVKFFLVGFTFLAALILYVAYLVQGEPFRRGPFIASVAVYLMISANSLVSVGHGIPGSFFGALGGVKTQLIAVIVGSLFVVVLFFIPVLGAGRVAARSVWPRAIASLELLLTGRLLSRPPACALAFGLLLGGLPAVVPYLVAAGGLFPEPWISGHGASLLTFPGAFLLWRVDIVVLVILLVLFGFLAPQLELRLRSKRLSRILFLILAAVALAVTEIEMPASAALAEGVLLAIIYDRVYRHFDFLTVLTTAAAGSVAANVLAILAQPPAALKSVATLALAGVGVLLAAALSVAFRGRVATVDFSHETRGPGRTEREQVRAEMQIARRAQIEMLPPASPTLERYAISAVCEPAREVGGDLYEFVDLPDGCLGIAVGDVSGKGMGAAYYMALTKGLLLGAAEGRLDPKETLAEVNRALYQLNANRVFVTMFYGVLDPAAGTLTYVRAGHNPVLWRRVKQSETLAPCPPGLALGMDRGKIFERTLRVKNIEIEPGDGLFFYSDGITEAMNRRYEEYGDERLHETVARTDDLGAEGCRDLVLADVASFVDEAPSNDDITLVVIRAL